MAGRLLALLAVVGAFILSASLSGDHIGVSSSCVNDDCIVGASSSLGSAVISILIIGILVFSPKLRTEVDPTRIVGVWRRLGAFYIDFALVLLVIAPITTLPILIAEAGYTGDFQWSFVRKFARPNDTLFVLPAVLLSFAGLYFYFFYHPWRRKQTVGEYILGFKIIAESERGLAPSFGLRPMISFIGLCAWPISLFFALRKDDKRFWWDAESRTRAVIVSSHQNQ